MNADELIEQINKRQEDLIKENKKYYEDILIYVRLSFDKSEQETEEILSEILDHILLAQEEGRSAVDVFGANPKEYLHELIGELPKMVPKKWSRMIVMMILYFLGSVVTFYPLIGMAIYYIFDKGELYQTFHLGTGIVILAISLPTGFILVYAVNYLLRWLCFRNIRKMWEFLLYWLYGVVSVGIFLAILFLMPSFGQVVQMPLYVMLIIGLVLYVAGRITRKNL